MGCLQVVQYGGAFTGRAGWKKSTNNDSWHCLSSYDNIFPLSAESALSCTITGLVSLQLANNYLRDLMNKFVQAVWIHTLWTVQTEITWTSYIIEAQPASARSCSLTCSKHSQITNRKPAAPINQILSQSKPFPKTQLHIQELGDATVCKERQMTERKSSTTLKAKSGYASSATREWRSALI